MKKNNMAKKTPEQIKKLKYEQTQRRRTRQFKSKICMIFSTAGFKYLPTNNKEKQFGNRTVEIDSIFVYENVILICEDTGTSQKNIKDHIRNKKEAFDEIVKNFAEVHKWLREEFSEITTVFEKYNPERFIIKQLYFSQEEIGLTNDELILYSMIKFIEPYVLSYLYKMTQCVKKSIKYEILRFLQINEEKIGIYSNEANRKTINATIISPKETTGLKNGIRIVSFMISAETLIKNAYVLRKDNWEDSIWLYQRLIQPKRITGIRQFIVEKETAFLNNIIVSLPNDVYFYNQDQKPIDIDSIGQYETCQMIIPDKMNSICIIDGQHRIYAHYEGLDNDRNESKVAELRKKLHLLVTGLIFPPKMSQSERARLESEIFLDINSNAKPVPPDVLLQIKMLKNPLSDIGLARKVIERLNREKIFLNKFELSSLDEGKIKIASIIKFALRYLVTIKPLEGNASFYTYWEGDKYALLDSDDSAIQNYIDYCTKNLSSYFCAIKKRFKKYWDDKESKILSVISINGFIIAYNRFLFNNGIKEFDYFDECFNKLNTDFSKDKFPYTSSQYRKFSDEIIKNAFDKINNIP